ncbi:transcriptional regulator [Ideonella sp. B7]|uniref:helix-turn-helix transcriptional regulator n=1 Tax=Ideonella benzenivorans TaxID=2831643 RepID=UPI001CECBF63|nr:WYL domain-containing protein [Ideonella benzenivorans]MCA6214961.1 transcriptional regulator [Ideonella benzenivorans]
MNRTERFYRIELLIKSRGGVNFETLMDELEVSRATLKRDLQYLRDRMDAPIVYDRFDNLYKFEGEAALGETAHQLPGVWFSESEILALLTMHQLIAGLDEGGVLGRHLQPLLDKLNGMLGTTASESKELMKRVKIVHPARRPVPSRWFEAIGSALLKRRRLDIVYFTRAKQSESQREVSPQRLIHYRNTWYLDAWCHQSDGLRRFALDAVRSAKVLDSRAKDVAVKTVETELDSGYGIFSGKAVQWANLVFTPEAAQWVSLEEWHPRQTLRTLADGCLEMKLPFADATELAMDILRHGPQVKVTAPAALARQVAQRLREAAAQYPQAAGK